MPGVEQDEQLEPSNEALGVFEWRRDQLVKALGGDYLELAERIAESSADLHVVLHQAARGCPPDLLARIYCD